MIFLEGVNSAAAGRNFLRGGDVGWNVLKVVAFSIGDEEDS